jgi:peptidoglycan/LPS O-acetylase OafA/YrhL
MKTVLRMFPVPTGATGPRYDRMNTLRTAAIVAVFFYHAFTATFGGSTQNMRAVAATWPEWMRVAGVVGFTTLSIGYHLVSIFFVMAGFFLHRSFLFWRERNPSEPWGRFTPFFLWRRFWRLVPPFWVALIVSYFLAYDRPFAAESLRKLVVNATLFKTLVPGYFFSINHAHWYVAVQWQLDLLCPVFLFMVSRVSFFAAFTTAFVLGYSFNFIVPLVTSAAYVVNLPFHWWADWAVGAFVAHAHSRDRRVFARPWTTVIVLALALLIATRFHLAPIVWVLLRIVFALLIEAVVLSRDRYTRLERRIAPIGLCSYSIYLFHVPLITLWRKLVGHFGFDLAYPPMWLVSSVLCFAVTVGLCWLSHRWVEEPSAAYGARLWRRLTLPRTGQRAAVSA